MWFRIADKDYHKLMALLVNIENNQRLLLSIQEIMMKTLDEILDEVAEESTTLDSLSTFIAGLKQQITDALSGVTLPAPVQAKVDAIFNAVEANKAKAAKAMEENVTV